VQRGAGPISRPRPLPGGLTAGSYLGTTWKPPGYRLGDGDGVGDGFGDEAAAWPLALAAFVALSSAVFIRARSLP
jgi:hypothetical protein